MSARLCQKQALVAAALARQTRAFELLHYHRAMHHLVLQPAAAEGLTTETFGKAFRHPGRYSSHPGEVAAGPDERKHATAKPHSGVNPALKSDFFIEHFFRESELNSLSFNDSDRFFMLPERGFAFLLR